MDVRFVSYSELKTYFEKERLEKDLEEKSKMGICSAADLLFITSLDICFPGNCPEI